MSFLEVNTEHISNTFGDEYDTYIESDNSTHHSAIKIVQDFVPADFTLPDSIFSPQLTSTGYLLTFPITAPLSRIPCKRFILNCVFLI